MSTSPRTWTACKAVTGSPRATSAACVATPTDIASRLGRETERYVLDGIGWCEYLQIASPGSGRVFVLERPLEAAARGSWVYVDRTADALDAVRDLFETLAIDLADLEGFASDFVVDTVALPRWTLWRQDDNGIRAEVADFTRPAQGRGRAAPLRVPAPQAGLLARRISADHASVNKCGG
ncbi:hypothetical protein [Nannocystis sp.]|uniref:hypothetical protein n=1 Tax=Nannocystis sp. TaxID=1962667 RepID=UPI0025E2B0D6|nr:hypothetical protein [Nannocystis sp.]MBK7829741.1 hypothetical protein [Nannocystis sp.]